MAIKGQGHIPNMIFGHRFDQIDSQSKSRTWNLTENKGLSIVRGSRGIIEDHFNKWSKDVFLGKVLSKVTV